MTQPNHLAAELRTIADRADAHDVHDRLHQLADRAERAVPATAERDAIHAGLEPEQEIRARALDVAVRARAMAPTVHDLVACAGELADWIRDGILPGDRR